MTERRRRLKIISDFFKGYEDYNFVEEYKRSTIHLLVYRYIGKRFGFDIKNDSIKLSIYRTKFEGSPTRMVQTTEDHMFENEIDCLDVITSELVLSSLSVHND